MVLLVVVLGAIGWAFQTFVQESLDEREEAAIHDVTALCWQLLGPAVMLIGASMILMVFDYAKIRAVVDRRRSIVVGAFSGLSFSFRRFWRCFRLFYLNLLLVAAMFGVFLLVGNQFSNATWGSVIGLFAVQQVFIISRIGMKLSFFASQLAMYESSIQRQSDVPAKVPSTPAPASTFRPMSA